VWDLSVDLPLGFTPEVRRSSLLILLEDAVRIGGGEFVDCKLEVALRFNANDFLLVSEELPPDSQFGFTPDVLRIGGFVGCVDVDINNKCGNCSSDARLICSV
jgi:hypothetical protein